MSVKICFLSRCIRSCSVTMALNRDLSELSSVSRTEMVRLALSSSYEVSKLEQKPNHGLVDLLFEH